MVAEFNKMFDRRDAYTLEGFLTTLEICFLMIDFGGPAREKLLGEPDAVPGPRTYNEDASFCLPELQFDDVIRILPLECKRRARVYEFKYFTIAAVGLQPMEIRV
jgi:hypothetical protein